MLAGKEEVESWSEDGVDGRRKARAKIGRVADKTRFQEAGGSLLLLVARWLDWS